MYKEITMDIMFLHEKTLTDTLFTIRIQEVIFSMPNGTQNPALSPSIGLMLSHRLRRWANITPMMGQCIAFAGLLPIIQEVILSTPDGIQSPAGTQNPALSGFPGGAIINSGGTVKRISSKPCDVVMVPLNTAYEALQKEILTKKLFTLFILINARGVYWNMGNYYRKIGNPSELRNQNGQDP